VVSVLDSGAKGPGFVVIFLVIPRSGSVVKVVIQNAVNYWKVTAEFGKVVTPQQLETEVVNTRKVALC